MTKAERQNRLLECIKDNHHISANTLAEKLGVSKRTILRDIQDLEDKGVQILAHQGKHGGYQITNDTDKYVLSMTEREITTLFLLLNESLTYTNLPYQYEIQSILKKCLNLPQTHLRRVLKKLDHYIRFNDQHIQPLPSIFNDILIYSSERNVMSVEFTTSEKPRSENVIFIGMVCENGSWHVICYVIGTGHTMPILINDIQDISYSFHKSIQTSDITLDNYQTFYE